MRVKMKAFELPDGSFIRAESSGGSVGAHPGDSRTWQSLDVYLVRSDGVEDILCCVEFEDGQGLRTLVFDEKADEPIFIKEHEFQKGERA